MRKKLESFTIIELMLIAIAIGLVLAILEVKFNFHVDPVGAIGVGVALGGVLDVTAVAPMQGWHQDPGGSTLSLVCHRFSAAPDGQLQHFTEDELRATIPPEGWDDYIVVWPEAEPVVRQLRAKVQPGGATSAAGESKSAPTLADATARAIAALKG